MEVRDAVEADAEALARLADGPVDVLRNLIHDRTVRVAVTAADGTGDEAERDTIAAFVSYDATPETVYVTQLSGERVACERLLEEPIRFARAEHMAVELLVPEDDEELNAVVSDTGFERVGIGPRFSGNKTIRYRHET